MLNNDNLLNNFRICSIKGNSYIPLNNRIIYVCIKSLFFKKVSFVTFILFFRCKQLQLTTIRAFFDLIDADTKQVCIFKLKVIAVK